MTKFLASSCAIIVLTFMATIAYAAPVLTILRNVLPETDSTYEIGTSSRAWLNIYTDQLCLAGDCKTTWPTGGGSGGGGNVSTSSVPVIGQLAYWTTTTVTPALLSTVATTSLAVTAPITFSGTLFAQIGGSGGSFGCTNASSGVTGCLTAADWTLFNNKVSSSSLAALFPFPKTAYGVSTSTTVGFTNGILVNAASSTIVGNATTTGTFFATTASSTNTFGAGLIPCTGGNVLTWTGGKFGCAADATGSGAWPFTPAVYNAPDDGELAVQSTTTPLWLKDTWIIASSTRINNYKNETGFISLMSWNEAAEEVTYVEAMKIRVTDGLTTMGLFGGDVGFISTGSSTISSGLFSTQQASSTMLTATNLFGGTLVLTNDLTVANGGTGASTLTGLLQGNGTSAITGITGTAGQFPYYNGTNTLLATSTIFLATTGNVGIGTTTPAYKLTINSDNATDNLFQIATTSNQKIFLVKSTGNVGIGAKVPAGQLSVSGGGQDSDDPFDTTGALGGTLVLDDTTLGNGHGGAILFTNNAQARRFAIIKGSLESGSNNTTGDIIFGVRNVNTDATLTEAMRIKFSGNVGIGTTSPNYKLAVQSASDGNMFQLYDTDGNCLQDPESGGITTTCTSDLKYKENIRNSGSMLDYFKDFVIREYEVKASGDTRIGVVAQELEITHPELVRDITSTSTFQVQGGTTTEIDAEGTEKEAPVYETREATTTSKFVELPSIWQIIKAIQDVWSKVAAIFRFEDGKATGMTLSDTATGDPYCIRVTSGVLLNTKGVCE